MGEEVRVKWKGKSRGIMTMIMALIEIEETEVSIHLIAPPIGKVSLPTPSLIMNMTRIIVTKEKIEEEGTIPKVVVPIDTTKAEKELKNYLENKYKNLLCYVMKDNLGYGKGNNFGINNPGMLAIISI